MLDPHLNPNPEPDPSLTLALSPAKAQLKPSRHGRPLSMLDESDADTEEDEGEQADQLPS